jgi:hypothetical protein
VRSGCAPIAPLLSCASGRDARLAHARGRSAVEKKAAGTALRSFGSAVDAASAAVRIFGQIRTGVAFHAARAGGDARAVGRASDADVTRLSDGAPAAARSALVVARQNACAAAEKIIRVAGDRALATGARARPIRDHAAHAAITAVHVVGRQVRAVLRFPVGARAEPVRRITARRASVAFALQHAVERAALGAAASAMRAGRRVRFAAVFSQIVAITVLRVARAGPADLAVVLQNARGLRIRCGSAHTAFAGAADVRIRLVDAFSNAGFLRSAARSVGCRAAVRGR